MEKFLSMNSILMLSLLVCFVAVGVKSDDSDWRDTGTQSLNSYREKHGCPDVSHDGTIDDVAQKYADYLAQNGQFDHSGNQNYGENLYANWGGNGDPAQVIQDAMSSWYSESSKYDYNNPGFSDDTGHFTAMIWKSTTQVGLGVSTAPDPQWGTYTVVVANFAPPGNVDGEYQDNVPPPTDGN